MPAKKTATKSPEVKDDVARKPKRGKKAVKPDALNHARFTNLLSEAMRLNTELKRYSVEIELHFGAEDAYATAGTLGVRLRYPETDDNHGLNGKQHDVLINLESNDFLFEDTVAGMRALICAEEQEIVASKRKDAALRKLTQEEREALNMGHWIDPWKRAARKP